MFLPGKKFHHEEHFVSPPSCSSPAWVPDARRPCGNPSSTPQGMRRQDRSQLQLWAVGAQGGLRRGPGWVLAAAAEGMRWGCGCSRPGAAKPRKRAGKGLGQCLSCCQCSGDVTPVSFKLGTQDFALGCMLLPRAKCELWGRVCQSKA